MLVLTQKKNFLQRFIQRTAAYFGRAERWRELAVRLAGGYKGQEGSLLGYDEKIIGSITIYPLSVPFQLEYGGNLPSGKPR